MQLYRVPHSTTVDGFYTSEIIVMAADHYAALEQVQQAIRRYIRSELDEYGSCSIGGHHINPSDEDCDVERLIGLVAASAAVEARDRMVRVDHGGLVLHRS